MKLIKLRNKAVVFLLLFLLSCTQAYTQQAKVYVTDTGQKYHLQSCRYLKYSRHEVSLKEARQKGYTACKVCASDLHVSVKTDTSSAITHDANAAPTQKKDIPYVTARRCSATTQAGARCKRMTKNANGKCWQHE